MLFSTLLDILLPLMTKVDDKCVSHCWQLICHQHGSDGFLAESRVYSWDRRM